MQDRKLILSQLGSSLVPIMIAVASLAGGGVVMMKRYQEDLKLAESIEIKNEYEAIVNDIKTILSEPASCKKTLEGWMPNENIIRDSVIIYDASIPGIAPFETYRSSINLQQAPPYGFSQIRIKSIVMGDRNDPTTGLILDDVTGFANLLVTFNLDKKRFGTSEKEVKIRLGVKVDTPDEKKIVSCSTAGDPALDSTYLSLSGGRMNGDIDMTDGAQIEFLSDKRFKKEIKNLGPTLQKIRQLKPVSYNWKANDFEGFGFLAQDVKLIFPELVHEKDHKLMVNYVQLVPILVKGLQEFKVKNKKLKIELNHLYKEHDSLKKNICTIEPNNSLCENY